MLKKMRNWLAEACGSPTTFSAFLPDDFFPPFFKFCADFFPTFLTTLDVLRRLYSIFVFCYAVQSLSRPYKTLSPFPGGGGVKAIPRTALLLSKSAIKA
jgi:hypothetical protein